MEGFSHDHSSDAFIAPNMNHHINFKPPPLNQPSPPSCSPLDSQVAIEKKS